MWLYIQSGSMDSWTGSFFSLCFLIFFLHETLSDQTDATFVRKSEALGSSPQLSALVPTRLWV